MVKCSTFATYVLRTTLLAFPSPYCTRKRIDGSTRTRYLRYEVPILSSHQSCPVLCARRKATEISKLTPCATQ
ncbi:hypothetical protein GGS21DRAFT_509792 [Xylaria nigripes]|nr:hypothetical protein GGS21DRAFT_509792 [Xylaria nigripes]